MGGLRRRKFRFCGVGVQNNSESIRGGSPKFFLTAPPYPFKWISPDLFWYGLRQIPIRDIMTHIGITVFRSSPGVSYRSRRGRRRKNQILWGLGSRKFRICVGPENQKPPVTRTLPIWDRGGSRTPRRASTCCKNYDKSHYRQLLISRIRISQIIV